MRWYRGGAGQARVSASRDESATARSLFDYPALVATRTGDSGATLSDWNTGPVASSRSSVNVTPRLSCHVVTTYHVQPPQTIVAPAATSFALTSTIRFFLSSCYASIVARKEYGVKRRPRFLRLTLYYVRDTIAAVQKEGARAATPGR